MFTALTGLGTLDDKLENAAEMWGVIEDVEPDELKHFQGFSNSFRIIANDLTPLNGNDFFDDCVAINIAAALAC